MKLKYLFVIVDKIKTRKMTEALMECGANALNIMPGLGTAPTALGDILGGGSDKSVITSTIEERYLSNLGDMLRDKFEFGVKRGAGVAFTIPVKAVAGPATLRILAGECAEEAGND